MHFIFHHKIIKYWHEIITESFCSFASQNFVWLKTTRAQTQLCQGQIAQDPPQATWLTTQSLYSLTCTAMSVGRPTPSPMTQTSHLADTTSHRSLSGNVQSQKDIARWVPRPGQDSQLHFNPWPTPRFPPTRDFYMTQLKEPIYLWIVIS